MTPGISADLTAMEERLRKERERTALELRLQLDDAVKNAEAAADEKAASSAAAVTAATALFAAELAHVRADAKHDGEEHDASTEAMSAKAREERERSLQELRAQLNQAVKNTEVYADEKAAAEGSGGQRPAVPHFLPSLLKSVSLSFIRMLLSAFASIWARAHQRETNGEV